MNPFTLSIRSQLHGALTFAETIPESLTAYLLPGAQVYIGCCPSGYLLLQEITTDDFSLWHYTILLTQDDNFLITGEQSLPCLNFCLKNSFFLSRRSSTEQLVFHEGQYNISLLLNIDLIAEFQKERVYSFLTLSYSQEILSKMAAVYPALASFLAGDCPKKESFLYLANQCATKEMKKILFRLLHEEYKEPETAISIKKGKVLELLVKAIEHPVRPILPCAIGLTRLDAEKIYKARDWLDGQFNRPITLFELARRVGMNVHKLSSGFLQITCTTVFHYHRKVRMTKAVELLAETDRSLFDIGTEVGYMDGKSFSKEFKKEKGIGPFEYRKRARMLHR